MDGKKLILLISGEICAGKTTLANELYRRYGFQIFKTKEVLKSQSKKTSTISLQRYGEKLDKETNGRWVRDHFSYLYLKKMDEAKFFVIDAIRIYEQIQHLRESFGFSTIHVHLNADPETLFKRFKAKYKPAKSATAVKAQYTKIKRDRTEKQVSQLHDKADLVIDTGNCNIEDIVIRVSSYLGILPSINEKLVDIVVGAQFGSEGKGQICGYLAPEYDALVRVGGPNAGHSVYSEPSIEIFHLLPSGTNRAPNAKLIIGPGAVLNLDVLTKEIRNYRIDTNRLVIDENATIITPEDISNECQLKEGIGSTGQGVGLATAHNIINRCDENRCKAKFFHKELKGFLGSAFEELEKLYAAGKRVLVEGTQGTFLSIHHGFYPYVTSRDTTASGCMAESGIAPGKVRKIIMVTRTYPIRVASPKGGTSGPFVSDELLWKTIAHRSGIELSELVKKEKTTTTKRRRRVAEFSWILFRKACELNSPTDIALSFADYLSIKNRDARRMEQLSSDTIEFIEELERCSGVPVSLINTRFDYRSVIDRRQWRRILREH